MGIKADLSLQESGALPSSGGRPPLRPISFRDPEIAVEHRADGSIYLRDRNDFPEAVCAEGSFGFHNHAGTDLPHAEHPDF